MLASWFLGHLTTAGLESRLVHFHNARANTKEERETSALGKLKKNNQKQDRAVGPQWPGGHPTLLLPFAGTIVSSCCAQEEQWDTAVACVASQRCPGMGFHMTGELVLLKSQ